jgi:DNA-cytosine methyltransferase
MLDASFLQGLDTPQNLQTHWPLVADSFAGGGGASTGIEMALGYSPDVAINHDAVALSMHAANHPETQHIINSIYAVDPRDLLKSNQRIGLAWFSPDCKHHSKAKGGKPLNKNIRDLAWVVVHWAKRVKPEVILLENVEEFQDWGPLTNEHKPDPNKKGETFRYWVTELRKLGYKVEWRQLRACDYGAPTIRKRLFVVARCDGRPIVWPAPTHGDPKSDAVIAGTLKPWRTAASIIDWSIPCPSIFDTSEQIMEKYGLRSVRPLADNTLRRVAKGIMKYVINAKDPFFVSYGQHGGASRSAFDPHHTITASLKDQNQIIVPNLVSYYGEGKGGNDRSHSMEQPITTVTTANRHAVVSAFLAQHNTGVIGRAADAPLSTITTRGTQQNIVAAHLMNMKGSQRSARAATEPVTTICAGGGHAALVSAFLIKYYGQGNGQRCDEALHTLTTRDRFGLVTVNIQGQEYAIADIGMRMLTPREQFRAQGFPDSYIIDRGHDGKTIPKTHQTQKCGNSVSPNVAAALVAANCAHLKRTF